MAATSGGDVLRAALRRLHARGGIRGWRIGVDHSTNLLCVTVGLPSGEELHYSLTEHEVRASRWDVESHLATVITSEVQRRARRARGVNARQWRFDEEAAPFEVTDAIIADGAVTAARISVLEVDEHINDFFRSAFGRISAPVDDERARDLFILVAGREAHDTLRRGEPLPLVGSKGGRYRLFHRMTFCVQDMKTSKLLCAVVPGVPIWDHLLGIKLMIEHDEPRFLGTANVSGERPRRRLWELLDGFWA